MILLHNETVLCMTCQSFFERMTCQSLRFNMTDDRSKKKNMTDESID